MNHDLYERITDAHLQTRPQVLVTPLSHSPLLSTMTGCQVYLKCEHLQHTGSFKFRGATNKIRLLSAEEQTKGVITASSGNHGQGIALAGRLKNIPVTVYVASNTSELKQDAIRALGAQVVVVDGTPLDAELEASRQAKLQGKTFVSPYNDVEVIAGQGTAGMEIAEQAAEAAVELAATFIAVGGGGLISGIGTALHYHSPRTKIVGCWPCNATSLYSSLAAGKIIDVEEFDTISDGTAGGIEPDSITFELCQHILSDTCLVTEAEIKAAMRLLAQTDRWMVEGAAGVAVASLLKQAPLYQGQAVAVVICGKNILLDKFIDAVK